MLDTCACVCVCVSAHMHGYSRMLLGFFFRSAFCHCNSPKWRGEMSLYSSRYYSQLQACIRCLVLCTPATSTSFWYWPTKLTWTASIQLPFGLAIFSQYIDCSRGEPPPVQAINVYWITLCFSKQKGGCWITIEKGLHLVSLPALLLQSTFYASLFPRMWNSSSSSVWTHLPFLQVLHLIFSNTCHLFFSHVVLCVLPSSVLFFSELGWLFSLYLPWHLVRLWRILSVLVCLSEEQRLSINLGQTL